MTAARFCSAFAAALLLVQTGAGHAQPAFTAASVGDLGSGRDGELVTPAGAGPFPAIVVMHGCNGVSPHYRRWTETLRGWGYVALLVDSFSSRGRSNICNRGREVPPQQRAQDAYRAADYLRALPNVRRDRVGVIGFSHGGWSVMHVVMAETAARLRATRFAAAVAYYPFCEDTTAPLVTDTLVLIGDADDWTPASRCQRWVSNVERAGRTLELKVYPGAYHAFDSVAGLRDYMGHKVGRDPAAAPDAEARTRAFFAARLAGP